MSNDRAIMFSKSAGNLVKLILTSLKPYKYRTLFALCCGTSMAFEKSVVPFLFKDLVDVLSSDARYMKMEVLIHIAVIFLVLATSEILYRANSLTMAFVYPKFQNAIRQKLYEHTMFHTAEFFKRNPVGDTGSKIYDIAMNAYTIVLTLLEVLIPITFSVVVTAFFILAVSKIIALFYSVWVITHILITAYMHYRSVRHVSRHTKDAHILQSHIVDTLLNIIHVKLFDNYSAELRNFTKHKTMEEKSNSKAIFAVEYTKLILCFVTILEALGIFGFTAYQWFYDRITNGELIFIIQTNISVILMLWWFTIETSSFVRIAGRSLGAMSIMDVANTHNEVGGGIVVTNGAIKFEDVYFSYDERFPLFTDFNIEIKAREKVAIVGLSGSGKTTFAGLILKSYEPRSGKIMIDGQDISKVSLKSLYRNITVISQSITLFNRSIAENIKYGLDEASDEAMMEAAEKANCHNFIMELPDQYNTVVGEGAFLSQGQKQRVLIARAILKDAPIIIMDEPTSALDNITESRIRAGMVNLIKNKTTIIIAHRLSTLSLVDKVIVMEHGKIDAFGTPDELSKSNVMYNRLWGDGAI